MIFLVGFMGAGKTTVGRMLSRHIGCGFEDLDDRIQAREGRSIEQIFRQSGEPAFRAAETAALRSIVEESSGDWRVVALGGGAFVQPENAALLKGTVTVFLDGPADELFARCQAQQLERPLRSSAGEFRRLYESRRPQYLQAKLKVETSGRSVEEVAAEVAANLGFSVKEKS